MFIDSIYLGNVRHRACACLFVNKVPADGNHYSKHSESNCVVHCLQAWDVWLAVRCNKMLLNQYDVSK